MTAVETLREEIRARREERSFDDVTHSSMKEVLNLLESATDQLERTTEALELVCGWSGIAPERRNTVVAIGVSDLLSGRDTEMLSKARDLVSLQVQERSRRLRL